MAQYYRDNFDRVPVGAPPHGVGEWDHLAHGNHRAVARVAAPAPAVCAYLPWRRRDRHPESKHVRVVAAATGAVIENSLVVTSNREYGEVVFEPVAGPGEYYLYYLAPMDDDHAHDWPRWAFPITRYLPLHHTAAPAWLEANGLGRDTLRTLPQTQIGFDANIPPEGDFGTAKMDGKVYPAFWRALPEAELVEFQSRTAWDSFFPMEIAATQDERIGVEHRGRYRPFLLFPESRSNPIRMTDALPRHWAVRELEELDRFADSACRNEYFVFQIGVYAHKGTVPDLRVAWSELAGPDGAAIPAAALTCFNTEGVDQHGRPFTITAHVETRKAQALWFGVDVPADAVPGAYDGQVTISSGDAPAQTVQLTLEVTAEALEDRGDGDHWRMSRLRWLNSRLGLDDDACPPYTPVTVDGRKVGVLGRAIELGANGLPARLTSHIDMFEIVPAGREILAAPAEVSIQIDGGSLPDFAGCALTSVVPANAVFRANATDDRLIAEHRTTVEAEGVIVNAITLTAREAATVENAQLTLSLPAAVARLILWPTDNADGGACPDAWEAEAWQLERLWVGDYNAGLALRAPPGDNAWDNAHRGRTVSGIPFGLPGELLMPEAGVARGMVYGVSQRFGWMPRELVNPSALWRWWDAFDIAGARMLGYWRPDCPVRVNHPDVRATAYVHPGQRLAVALASWATEPVIVAVDVDWPAVGLSPHAVAARIPAIDCFQPGQPSVSLDAVTIEPGKGWIIEVHAGS